MTRLKDVAIINRASLPETTAPDRVLKYVDIGSVSGLGSLEAEELLFQEAPSRARRLVRSGDTIVSTVRTYLRAVAFIDEAKELVVSTGFATLTPREGIEPRFLYWLVRGSDFIETVVSRSVGVSYPAITATELGAVDVSVPPPAQQRRVAAFLDSATERIDELIGEQENLKSLLTERLRANREALLLGPVQDRRSGWDYGRLKRFVTVARGRFTHRPRNDPALYDGPYPFIQTGDIAAATDGDIGSWSQTLNELGLAASRMAPAGTIVMAIAANIGDVARLGFDACFPDSVVAIAPRSQVTPEYLFELIQALRKDLISTATLNTQLNINVERIGDIEVAIPPIPEQRQLVAGLARRQSEASAVNTEIDHQIALLREHRQALITAAVSGGLAPLDEVA